MSPTSGAPSMAVENDKLRAAALSIAATCFIALAISLCFIKQFFINPKRKKSCYLNTEHKPQHGFKRVFADNSYSQFKHLDLHTVDSQSDDFSNLHPYRVEISKLMKNPNLEFLEYLGECEKGNLEMRGSYVWVETEAQLKEVVEVLSKERVFAVDTEQHSFRSFLGFTALIQISTTREDYLVDTIILHDVMGLLRPVFANPGICKVFHGADNDVLWLQRDFHIYVVNLLDTAKACDILSKPQRSLAYLLETYSSVSTNKLLQYDPFGLIHMAKNVPRGRETFITTTGFALPWAYQEDTIVSDQLCISTMIPFIVTYDSAKLKRLGPTTPYDHCRS
ncbi:Protein RRP6-like 3 [Orobanche hederae]